MNYEILHTKLRLAIYSLDNCDWTEAEMFAGESIVGRVDVLDAIRDVLESEAVNSKNLVLNKEQCLALWEVLSKEFIPHDGHGNVVRQIILDAFQIANGGDDEVKKEAKEPVNSENEEEGTQQ